MRARIIKLISFIVALALSSLFLCAFVYPKMKMTGPLWGSDLMYRKSAYLQAHGSAFNGVFIGSSMVFRQVDPLVIDSTVRAVAGVDIRSFNFGINWLGGSESLYVLEELLKSDSLSLKYVFVELQKIKSVDYPNFFTNRILYWYSWPWYLFTVRAGQASRLPAYAKAHLLLSHSVNYAGHLLNLGYLTEALEFDHAKRQPLETVEFAGPAGNGFISLEQQLEIYRQDDPEAVAGRNVLFLKDTSVVTQRRRINERARAKLAAVQGRPPDFNAVYASELNRLICRLDKRGIRVVFFLPPRLDLNQYLEIIPVFNSLPPSNRIDLSDPARYPGFYLAQYSYDMTHMNRAGAVLYSERLAEAFARLPEIQ